MTEGEAHSTIKVKMLIFSGRPNPQWTLTPQQTEEMRRRVVALAPASGTRQPATGLGYLGFDVVCSQPIDPMPSHAVVYDSAVMVPGGAGSQLRDDGRRLEQWLLSTAPESVPPEAVSAAARAIAAG